MWDLYQRITRLFLGCFDHGSYGWLSKSWSPFRIPKYYIPSYTKESKGNHSFDNHAYVNTSVDHRFAAGLANLLGDPPVEARKLEQDRPPTPHKGQTEHQPPAYIILHPSSKFSESIVQGPITPTVLGILVSKQPRADGRQVQHP